MSTFSFSAWPQWDSAFVTLECDSCGRELHSSTRISLSDAIELAAAHRCDTPVP